MKTKNDSAKHVDKQVNDKITDLSLLLQMQQGHL